MTDTCKCDNGCSSTRQLSIYPKYRFPKRLLVAVSIVVIITMCIMPAEGRSTPNKHRHARHMEMEKTEKADGDKVRRQRPFRTSYNTAMKKFVARLKNNKRFLDADKKVLRLHEFDMYYKNRRPSWVPSLNFVDIHFFDNRTQATGPHGGSPASRRFKFLTRKLYKSTTEYLDIFKRLLDLEMDFPDDPFQTFKSNRLRAIRNTIDKLQLTIQDIKDYANITNVNPKKKLDLSSLKTKLSRNECTEYDYIAFKNYSNTIQNWQLELKCTWLRKKYASRPLCQKFEMRMREKRQKVGH